MLTRSFDEKEKKLQPIWAEAKDNERSGQEIAHRMYDVGYKDGSTDSVQAGVFIGAAGALASVIVLAWAVNAKNAIQRKIRDYRAKKALK